MLLRKESPRAVVCVAVGPVRAAVVCVEYASRPEMSRDLLDRCAAARPGCCLVLKPVVPCLRLHGSSCPAAGGDRAVQQAEPASRHLDGIRRSTGNLGVLTEKLLALIAEQCAERAVVLVGLMTCNGLTQPASACGAAWQG